VKFRSAKSPEVLSCRVPMNRPTSEHFRAALAIRIHPATILRDRCTQAPLFRMIEDAIMVDHCPRKPAGNPQACY
jgi:hypothetical protein